MSEQKGKVNRVSSRDWQDPNGNWYYDVTFEDGYTGVIASKGSKVEELPFKVGEEIKYEITNPDKKRIKLIKEEEEKPQGKYQADPKKLEFESKKLKWELARSVVTTSTSYTKDIAVALVEKGLLNQDTVLDFVKEAGQEIFNFQSSKVNDFLK